MITRGTVGAHVVGVSEGGTAVRQQRRRRSLGRLSPKQWTPKLGPSLAARGASRVLHGSMPRNQAIAEQSTMRCMRNRNLSSSGNQTPEDWVVCNFVSLADPGLASREWHRFPVQEHIASGTCGRRFRGAHACRSRYSSAITLRLLHSAGRPPNPPSSACKPGSGQWCYQVEFHLWEISTVDSCGGGREPGTSNPGEHLGSRLHSGSLTRRGTLECFRHFRRRVVSTRSYTEASGVTIVTHPQYPSHPHQKVKSRPDDPMCSPRKEVRNVRQVHML